MLAKKPFFAKEKVYENYVEAYKAKQLIPENLDIGNLVSHYQQAFDKAIATRKFVRELAEGNARDGRPLAHTKGYIKTLTPEEGSVTKPVHFVKPRGSKEEFADYVRGPENAAFRNWKWVETDTQGAQTFLEGEMYFHPEIAQKIKNIFGGSAIRKSVVGRGALKFAATMKGTLLDLSGFHQTQVGLHAIYHKVNPFNAAKIDVTNPLTKELIDSGTMIFDYHNANAFAEGVSGHGSLLHKIPGIGGYLDMYTDYLFKDYIPRLKMQMAHGAFSRNMKIYGNKMSRGDIAKLTSDQANAAFGELNYAALGRNKTFQDVMRLGLLAPDFLEARARFAGQALRPKGREQFMAAVVRGSIITYSGARIVNALLNDGDPKWDKPFSLVIGDKEFLARSVPGDAYHLLKDWRSFIYHRLNPTMVRPIMEAVTSRVYTGRWVSPEDQLKDFFRSHIPIAFQRTADQKWWQSAMNAMGVTAMDERSRALQEAVKIRQRSTFAHPTKKSEEESKLVVGYIKELEKSTLPEDRKEIFGRMREDVLAKKLSPKDVKKALHESMYTPLQRVVKPMAIENALYIWTLANGKEKRSLVGVIQKKIPHLESTRREELMPTLVQFMLDVKAMGEEDKKKQPDVFDKLEALSGKKVE
jgi:hypothetical protein